MSSQTSDDLDAEQRWANIEEYSSRAVTALRDFMRSRDKRFQDIVSLNPPELNGFIKEFYLALKDSVDEELTGTGSITRIKADLHKFFLKAAKIDISVLTGSDLSEGTLATEEPSAITHKEVSMKGPTMKKHTRQRTFTFDTNELRQIYMSDAMNMDKPETLQNKVFFDVCMYICNRGKDFLRLMTKSDFEVSTDQNGIRYVWLKYDSKFSFQEVAGGMTFEGSPGSQIGERMYERKGDPKCPVLSYTAYVIHLHPMSDAFWQRPKRSILPTDFVWYDNISIGNSTLNKLMNRITQSAGLPDSYPINAIKSSYIPVIESICRSALFGSQQFRRILQMKHSNQPDNIHLVRKRHSEGSLSIASTLNSSALFRPRLSEPRLPVYMLNAEEEALRCSSASPILRGNSWPDAGSPLIQLSKTNKSVDRGDNSPDSGYQLYRNSEGNNPRNYSPAYSDTGQNGQAHTDGRGEHISPARDFPYREEVKPETGTAHILHAKEKCLDIVHSLEVRDIKSFVNWMKTFEVKHGPRGLTVTCQPVNAGEIDTKVSRSDTPNNTYSQEALHQQLTEKRSNSLHRQGSEAEDKKPFIVRPQEFDCSGSTFCCSSAEVAPVKITVPNQETVLLTGLTPGSQVLVHNRENMETQYSGNEQFSPLHTRIFASKNEYDLEHINTFSLKQDLHNGTRQERSGAHDFNRSDSFKEERSIPMKKRIIVDQHEQNHTQSFAQSISSPQSYTHSRSPPPLAAHPTHASHPSHYIQQAKYLQSAHTTPHSVPQAIPEYRPTFTEAWGYMPMHKRQKFAIQHNTSREDGPLDLIKQS